MTPSHTGTSPDSTQADRHPADLVEAGNLLRTQPDLAQAKSPKAQDRITSERHEVIVIGAGQAGLSVSYHLARKGIDHIVLERAPRIGDVWRKRWDSLRLFTPAKFDGLDGYRFPGKPDAFPTKDQMADYLEAYASTFDLPVRLNAPAQRLYRTNGRFRVETEGDTYEANQVVVAAASYQKPSVPAFASKVDNAIKQMHSHEYRNPGQIPDGPVLLVGGGNSGAEIAMDLIGTHKVTLSGREVGHIPFDISGFLGRKILVRLVVRGLFHRVLTMKTPMGRKFRKKMHGHGMPLIRTRPGQLEAAGVKRVDRIAGFKDGKFVTAEGTEIPCATVIWCTGYHPGFDWIDLPVLDDRGLPRQKFGKSVDMEGLYFAGLHFQYAVSSTMVSGVGRDARRVVEWISASD